MRTRPPPRPPRPPSTASPLVARSLIPNSSRILSRNRNATLQRTNIASLSVGDANPESLVARRVELIEHSTGGCSAAPATGVRCIG